MSLTHAFVLAYLVGVPAQDDSDSLRSTCARWSLPQPVPAAAGTDILGPSLAVDRTGAGVLIGNRVGPRHEPLPEPELALYPLAGGVITPPPGDFAFLYPRAAFDAAARLHLVWGEPSRPGTGSERQSRGCGTRPTTRTATGQCQP